MRNEDPLILIVAVVLSLSIAATFTLADLQVKRDGDTATISCEGCEIVITENQSTAPEPDPRPTPQPDPVQRDCKPDSSAIARAALSWEKPPGQTRIELSGNRTYAYPFKTTRGKNYAGQLSFAATTGTSGIQREVWISQCKGGDPIPAPACQDKGTSSTVVRWAQYRIKGYCSLERNHNYWLNIRNRNCPKGESCDVFRNQYNNGEP
jgi:hypothetical protein